MLKSIFTTFANCFKIPELKSRILFTALLLGICRLASLIPTPGLNSQLLVQYFQSAAGRSTGGGGLMGMYSMFTGGGFEKCAVGSLGIMPYISATIVMQLLTAVVPTLSKLSREEGGRVKIIKYSRYLTVLICMGQGIWMAMNWERPGGIFPGFTQPLVLIQNLWWYRFQTVLILTTGTLLLMWLGEQITERGIGNGISLVITIGILGRFPAACISMFDMFRSTKSGGAPLNWGHAIVLLALLIGVIAGCIAVTQAQSITAKGTPVSQSLSTSRPVM